MTFVRYVKPKYGKKAKLCAMDTDSFIVYIKQMIFIISEDKVDLICSRFDSRFDTSNYELDSQLSKGSNKKVIGLMKDE